MALNGLFCECVVKKLLTHSFSKGPDAVASEAILNCGEHVEGRTIDAPWRLRCGGRVSLPAGGGIWEMAVSISQKTEFFGLETARFCIFGDLILWL